MEVTQRFMLHCQRLNLPLESVDQNGNFTFLPSATLAQIGQIVGEWAAFDKRKYRRKSHAALMAEINALMPMKWRDAVNCAIVETVRENPSILKQHGIDIVGNEPDI